MKSIDSLKKLYKTASDIPQRKFLSEESEEKIASDIETVKNLFVEPILTLLFENKHNELVERANRIDPKTSLYVFIKFAESLCADETDFDFLTNPKNAEYYKKLRKFAVKFNKQIPGYINILEKICDNKTLGLYTEFQEVYFFFKEFSNSSTLDFASFFEDYKRILKLQTQKIFNEFIAINLFDQTLKILDKNKTKIDDANALKCYVYGALFYKLNLSNKNENLLLKHIEFCIRYLAEQNIVKYEGIQKGKYFVQYGDLERRLELCFNTHKLEEKSKLVPLLKDYSLNDSEIVLFSEILRNVLNGETVSMNLSQNKTKIEALLFSLFSDNAIVLFLLSFFYVARIGNVDLQSIEISKEIFERFYNDNLFEKVNNIIYKYSISNEKNLCFYVYGLLYYQLHLTNKNENLLLQHIKYFVEFLWDGKIPNSNQNNKRKYFVGVDLTLRLKWLFERRNINNKSKLIPLLKDYSLNDEDIVVFCGQLQKVFDGESVKIKIKPSVDAVRKVVFSLNKSGAIIIFLRSLFGLVLQNKVVSLEKIEAMKYHDILTNIVQSHFMTIKVDEKIKTDIMVLYQYRNQISVYYNELKYLFENDVFSKILATYNRHKDFSEQEVVSFIAKSFNEITDKSKLTGMISILYSIVIKEFKLKFDVGDMIKNSYYGIGRVVQIAKEMDFCYRVSWVGGKVYTYTVADNDKFELENKQWLGRISN